MAVKIDLARTYDKVECQLCPIDSQVSTREKF